MGSLDNPTGSVVKREIKIYDATGKTAAQIETAYNTNFGQVGWRIIQIVQLGSNVYIVAEREIA